MDRREQVKLLLRRIKTSQDGPDFIEYLEELSKDNYKAWVRSEANMDGIHKGYAQAIDSLIRSFAECTKEQIKITKGIVDFT